MCRKKSLSNYFPLKKSYHNKAYFINILSKVRPIFLLCTLYFVHIALCAILDKRWLFLTWGKITTQFSHSSGFWKYAHFLGKTCWHDRWDYHITRIYFYNAPKGHIAHGQNLKNGQNLLGGGKFVGFRFWWKWHHRIRKMQEIEWWYF